MTPARKFYFAFSFLSLLAIAIGYQFWPPAINFLYFVIPYILIGIYDMYFTTHNILRLYPVIGHLRYMFEFIRPEMQQYFIATNTSGRPFNREIRTLVYQRAQKERDTLPFGTQHDIMEVGYELAYHSLSPKILPDSCARITVGNEQCKQPYNASILNSSAMSFGALSPNAVKAINLGAQLANFAQNTGEGGISPYHLSGGDLIWQVGTGYFGCRTPDGHFDPDLFQANATRECVKMIELKLSQGAKPSHGGILPAAKISPEIAEIRGIEMGKDCDSPPAHSAFSTPTGLLEFIAQLRELSGGKPIGFKLCLGRRSDFMSICKAMLKTEIYPDFITIDGAEGGTGAAPVEFTNRLGVPIHEALVFVHSTLLGCNLRDKIRVIASGKVATGFDMITKLALGADMCNTARAFMFSIGCIQALTCNTNNCPTGVTTQNPDRNRAINVNGKKQHVVNYHNATIQSCLDLAGAMGVTNLNELEPHLIHRRISDETSKTYKEIYTYLEPGELLTDNINPNYASCWQYASAESF